MAWLEILGQQFCAEGRVAHDRDAFVERLVGNRAVARPRQEGMDRALKPQHQADRAALHLRLDRQAAARRAVEPLQQLAPLVGHHIGLHQ